MKRLNLWNNFTIGLVLYTYTFTETCTNKDKNNAEITYKI